jgi:hypothetical protein
VIFPAIYFLFAILSLAMSSLDPKYRMIIFKFRLVGLVMMVIAQVLLWPIPLGGLLGTILTIGVLGAPLVFVEGHIRRELRRRGHLPGRTRRSIG